MALTERDAIYWSGIETVTIEEAGHLLYGIEPHSFKYEQECSYNAHPGFFEMGANEEVVRLSEIVERAALARCIEIAYEKAGVITFFDGEKTHLKMVSFLSWCKSTPKYAATASSLDLATYLMTSECIEETSDSTQCNTTHSRGPSLKEGRNPRKAVEEWVAYLARSMADDYQNIADLAEQIWKIADKNKYESTLGKMSVESITRMIPAGLTGGRGKTKGRPKNLPSMTFGEGEIRTNVKN